MMWIFLSRHHIHRLFAKSSRYLETVPPRLEEEYEYANKLVKQGVKNPRQVPKFTIIHERFSHAIEKITIVSTPTQ